MQTLKAGTLAKNNGASCLVPALALKLCSEIQPGKGCQCQTVPEKRSYFQPGAAPWAGSPQPCASAGEAATGGQGQVAVAGVASSTPWHGWVPGRTLPVECGGTGSLLPRCSVLGSPRSPCSAGAS